MVGLAGSSMQHGASVEKGAQVMAIGGRSKMNDVHDGYDERAVMEKWRVEMWDVEKIAMAGRARNKELFAKGIDGFVDNSNAGAELLDAAGVLPADDGSDGETVEIMMELLKEVTGISTDPSNQPTRINCDGPRQS